MTWAMVNPPQFGEWSPEPQGGFVGWHDALRKYYETEMSEADKAALNMVDSIDNYIFSRKFVTDMGPVRPEECPRVFETRKFPKKLGSLISLSNRFLAVDEAMKAIIEGLEAGIHQFYPLKITSQKSEDYPKPYFGLVIRQFRDSFRPDDSVEGSWAPNELVEDSYCAKYNLKECIVGLALSKEEIGSAHLWREIKLREPGVFFSDELQAEAKRQGLRLPKHFKVKDV
ncbi:hypothetical protein RA27_06820 [Ruegeria sp. ANG-R]|uniref:imm11 family protein n=1 Tax=Ruegeria sp. ANG-R TaxID=1577903 RepID=UPI00057FECD4|nr:DUF1629 domain-containing protein [Ruegeria sp. ANG-R]KIC43025.1 hypothetical protein RA27_06820 [Ruegeria sp. ANG-R]